MPAMHYQHGARTPALTPTILQAAWVVLIGCAFLSAIAAAQENPATQETSEAANGETKDNAESPKKAEKRIKASAALAAIGGIAVFGVGAIAVTILWARRLRRLARDLGPTQKTAGNDFWFLKPPKATVGGSEIGEAHQPPPSTPTTETPE